MAEIKKDLDSLMAAYEQSAAREPGCAEECKHYSNLITSGLPEYVISQDYSPILIFAFADGEDSNTSKGTAEE